MCYGGPTYSVHPIYTAYQSFCSDHCTCVGQSTDLNRILAGKSHGRLRNKENSRPKRPVPGHRCSGTCSEVARSCSWAYTGDCMCTAASTPDPWGLFASHGCVAIVKASLGGRDLASNQSSLSFTNSSDAVAPPPQKHAIVKGSQGYYNASTGDRIACPCNSTCVSYGCCGSNGQTRVPEDKCLGKLDMTDIVPDGDIAVEEESD